MVENVQANALIDDLDRSRIVSDILAIDDWRHPYEIEGKPNELEKAWFREWHPWRWSIDRPVINEALGDLKGATLLDVACNDGWYGFQAAEDCAIVTGIDGRKDAIQRANLIRQYFEVDNIQYVVGDIEDESSLTGTYDVTLFYGILYHLSDPIRVIDRLGKMTNRIMAVQTFIHALDPNPVLHLLRENPELPGKALTQLITTPTQRAVVMMLKDAGFDHVYRGMPSNYFAGKVNSNARWQWCFFYGVKGRPLKDSNVLIRIEEDDRPLNHFGFIGKIQGQAERFARRILKRETRGGF
ncbi:MAG: class I SAM-dependent methyltransferase [Paracoccaceae bacterium]